MAGKRGNKHRCGTCGTTYYDLNKPSPSCPKCGTFYVPDTPGKKPKKPIAAAAKRKSTTQSGREERKPGSDLWICAVESGNSVATVISGPTTLDTSNLTEPGWYFFKPDKNAQHKSLPPKSAIHLKEVPTNGIRSYLETYAFKGIGPETAKKLAVPETENIYADLSRPSEVLSSKYGINAEMAAKFEKAWAKTIEARDLQIMLRQLGLGNAVVKQIRETLGNGVVEKLLSNPYELVREISYFTFEDAERIVGGLNLNLSEDQRIISAMELCLFRIENQRGHTCAPLTRAFKDITNLIDVDHDIMEGCLRSAGDQFHFAEYGDQEYIATQASAERAKNIASRFETLLSDIENRQQQADVDPVELKLPVSRKLSEEQEAALNDAINSPAFLITGGPGTGKTTMVIAIVKALKNQDRWVTLCAPTGRAAKRLEEVPGLKNFQPTTIHRLLIDVKAGRIKDIGTLIIDEASMIDADLMVNVLDILSEKDSIIMIGDADQLPPVGPGQVFKDLLNSDTLPTARLTVNFRQLEGSNIVTLAQNVIHGTTPQLDEITSENDVEFIREFDEKKLQSLILDLYLRSLPERLGLEASEDIQIMVPMRKGPVGTEALNKAIQANKWGNAKPLIKQEYRDPLFKGDKVIQTSNNYDIGVMNGDIGTILRGDDHIVVEFGGKEFQYTPDDALALEPAYAISIHKSQGSEYSAVIIPIAKSHQFMLGRNLLYTAITRGKQHVIIVGNDEAFKAGINATRRDFRYTILRHIL